MSNASDRSTRSTFQRRLDVVRWRRRKRRNRKRAAATKRFYRYSKQPISDAPIGAPEAEALRLAIYETSVDVWKELSGIRFKILALLPAISGAVLAAILLDDEAFEIWREVAKLALTLFGLTITYALRQYDRRNSQLYDELISRARRAEHELGVNTGAFLGRPSSTRPLVQHDRSLNMIYNACLLIWLAAAVIIGRGLWVSQSAPEQIDEAGSSRSASIQPVFQNAIGTHQRV